MPTVLILFFQNLKGVFMDILPILLVISFFQIAVLQKPFPDLDKIIVGVILVVIGLLIFIEGLEMALFPIGERKANQFALKGNAIWIVFFGFALGFSTTIAEPALTLIAQKSGEMAATAGAISRDENSINFYVLGLRLTVALSVGMAVALGVFRIL